MAWEGSGALGEYAWLTFRPQEGPRFFHFVARPGWKDLPLTLLVVALASALPAPRVARAQALQAQISPHFFFNTLTTISALAFRGKASIDFVSDGPERVKVGLMVPLAGGTR